MIRTSTLVSFFSCFLFFACGSSSGDGAPSPTGTAASATDYCSSYCARENQCDATKDTKICADECTNTNAASMSKVRADFIGQVEDCEKSQQCSFILDGSAEKSCVDLAKGRFPASDAATRLCSALADAATRCSGTLDQAACVASASVYTDGVVAGAQSCASHPCNTISECLNAAFGAK